MSTKIEWTDETWNPVRGCSLVSDGCRHCYAMKQAHRFSGKGGKYEGLTELGPDGPRWTGKLRMVPELLDLPLRWKKPRMIFVNSMSDLFHGDVPFDFINHVFSTMFRCPQHTFQILTKRPERMLDYVSRSAFLSNAPFDNVWLGVSVENQKAADERIPLLLQTPAAVRFVSAEPLLGPINLRFPTGKNPNQDTWVIVGGESGPGARPMHPDWASSLRDQCNGAGVPFFFKQWGAWVESNQESLWDGKHHRIGLMSGEPWFHHHGNGVGAYMYNLGKKRAGSLLDGREWKEYPKMRGVVDSQIVTNQREKMST